MSTNTGANQAPKKQQFRDKDKDKDVRSSNIVAAKAVADCVRTSLGPKGMDKMISSPTGEVMITNDGATILKQMNLIHPAAKMLMELSHAQDVEAGDGTTTVVIIAGALLNACSNLLARGIHPSTISDAFAHACNEAVTALEKVAIPVDLSDRDSLLKNAITSLNSKVVSQNASILAPIAVDAVLKVIDPKTAINVDLNDVKIVKKVGGTIDDTELIEGLVFEQRVPNTPGAPTSVKDAKIGLIQFCLSPPKPNMDSNVYVTDYTQMDRIFREERKYLLDLCNKIKKTGCNVLLIQKSILRDAVTDLSLHILAKLKIMVVKDIERSDIEFISKTLGCQPIASIESFLPNKLGTAGLVAEESVGEEKIVKITGVPNVGQTVTVLCRGSNRMMVDESERSIHDALCVIRSLVKKRFLIAGGGAPEIEASLHLQEVSKASEGIESYCIKSFAEALEVIPYTLAENAGLPPIPIVTELRNKHTRGEKTAGINVRKGIVSDSLSENVIQPLLVTTSALTLATETVRMILKIDDIVQTR
eukprot:TRINITY_DN1034_c0_g1_i1.p1 TRINITY_DN1034_c0_g1~~TRINITY_DN1034_c0_g1_i1.p1  ORF type:complete len:544 (+),score=137.89 TRINITY_DN1034_c0_g1_i1:36-1634(+)